MPKHPDGGGEEVVEARIDSPSAAPSATLHVTVELPKAPDDFQVMWLPSRWDQMDRMDV